MTLQTKDHSRVALPFLLAVVGAALILLVTLLLPLGFDNDVYESMAWTLYAYHGLPYLASWDMNFPGIVFIHWASIGLFGASDFGFRAFDYLAHILMAAVYYRLLRVWLSQKESVVAVLLYSLYYASGTWGLAGQRDTYAALLVLVTMLLFFKERMKSTVVRSLSLGICLGGAMLIRPTYVFFAIAFVILLWNVPTRLRTIGLVVLGCAIPFLLFLIPYLSVSGGLSQVYDSIIRFNLDVYSSVSVPVNLWTRGRALIYVFAIIGLIPFRNGIQDKLLAHEDRRLILFLVSSALLSPIVMGKYFTYHFESFMLIAIAFAGRGICKLTLVLPRRWPQWSFLAGVFIFFAFAYYPRQLIRYYFQSWNTGRPIQATYERVLSDSLFGIVPQQEVKSYVDHSLRPTDRIEYASLFPGLRWRLRRPETTRFTTILPLATPQGKVPGYIARWRREFLDSLSTARPRFIITSRSEEWWPFAHVTADSALRSIDGFDSLLSTNYTRDTVIRGFTIYRLRP